MHNHKRGSHEQSCHNSACHLRPNLSVVQVILWLDESFVDSAPNIPGEVVSSGWWLGGIRKLKLVLLFAPCRWLHGDWLRPWAGLMAALRFVGNRPAPTANAYQVYLCVPTGRNDESLCADIKLWTEFVKHRLKTEVAISAHSDYVHRDGRNASRLHPYRNFEYA